MLKEIPLEALADARGASSLLTTEGKASMIYRLVDRGVDGEPRVRDFSDVAELTARFEKIGVDDCSADLRMRGFPIFRGLIGPMPERDGTVARYETPEIFEKLTKEWSAPQRRKSKRKAPGEDADAPV